MKKKLIVSVIALVLLLFICITGWTEITLTDFTGKVEVQMPGSLWQGAVRDLVLPLGTMISTSFNSTATIDLGSSVVLVQEFTRMAVENLVEQGGVITTDLQLNVGKIRAQVESAENLVHDFNVLSTVSVASVRGTDFEYDGESLFCYAGEVLFFNLIEQKRTVRTGEEVRLVEGEPPLSPPETFRRFYRNVQVTPTVSPDIPGGDEPEVVLPDTGAVTDAEVTATILWPDS